MSIREYLKTVARGENLTFEEARDLSNELMAGEIDPIQVSGLLVGLKVKGETCDEISGFARGLKLNAIKLSPKRTGFYDIVGTGGDGADTFNISTTCAFVLSGAGLNIAKHGNRSISSQCGSSDVLDHLGVNIHGTPQCIEEQLSTMGLAFIYAPLAHPSMKNVMQVRKNLGIPTIFNIIGPLANPLAVEGQYIGVFSPSLVEVMARSMIRLGVSKGAVVHGFGGLDEASLEGENRVAFVRNGRIETRKIAASDFGLMRAENRFLKGGAAPRNADMLKRVLEGERGPGRDVVLLNAGIALYAFDEARSIQEGIKLAARSIDEGKAMGKLQELIALSNRSGVCHG